MPIVGIAVLAVTWGRDPGVIGVAVAFVIVATVLVAVHHAEVVADRVGEPFGSVVLAVAVTVIEVGLIVMLTTSGGRETETLARDTVFAAVMITTNGIAGLALYVGASRHGLATFNAEGSGAALATVTTLAAVSLVLPTFTTSAIGPEFTTSQLVFASVVSLALYSVFMVTQTVGHREFFVAADETGTVDDGHTPTPAQAWGSFALLMLALVAVVGLAKVESPAIETAVARAGWPQSAVGVIIALLVLLPETLAAVRHAHRDRLQLSLNIAFGSAMASIGLTIPTIAVLSLALDRKLILGLGGTQVVLLALTALVGTLTVVPGRATRLQGAVHLVLLASFLFLAANP